VHCHPFNKTITSGWTIDFDSNGTYKSHLMFWKGANADPQSNVRISTATLAGAVAFCEENGWGYDLTLPHYKWHQKKNYADNFKYKGEPKEEIFYD
jgi:NADH dehydrogenase (ubiquinone) Fe-S protein 4